MQSAMCQADRNYDAQSPLLPTLHMDPELPTTVEAAGLLPRLVLPSSHTKVLVGQSRLESPTVGVK